MEMLFSDEQSKIVKIENKKMYLILSFYALLIIIFGLLSDSLYNITNGIYNIIINPDLLITDYIMIGGIGATFVNSGLLTIICILIMYLSKISITGASISTIWIVSGFSLFGKNIVNIWFIILGVFLYSLFQRESFSKYIYIAFLGTGLSPLITQIMFNTSLSKTNAIIYGIIAGITIGFILPPLSSNLMRVHQGFNLYNIGFTSGIIGTMFVSVFRLYGFLSEKRMIWSSGNNLVLSIFLSIMFISMIIYGYILNNNSFNGFYSIFNYSGKLITDFTILKGFPVCLINMGVNGLVSMLIVILTNNDLNGPTIGAIFTIVGFSAFGKHLKNMLPIITGVFIAGFTNGSLINSPYLILAALFGTTLAPISGKFGWFYGMIAGFLQLSLTLNISYLHGGFNLYNSGFAGGLVAAFLIPIIEVFRKDDI